MITDYTRDGAVRSAKLPVGFVRYNEDSGIGILETISGITNFRPVGPVLHVFDGEAQYPLARVLGPDLARQISAFLLL